MDIIDRIFELVDKQFKEQKDFAAAVGVSDDTVSDWRRRKSASCTKSKHLTRIAEVLGTTTDFLNYGYQPFSTLPCAAPLDPESLDIAAAYQQADERSRAMVRLALGLDDAMANAARGGKVVKKPSPVSAETLDELSRATEKAAEKENNRD